MNRPVLKIYLKSIVLLLPLLLIISSFIVIDPFGILHNDKPKYETSADFLSTERYLKNTKHKVYNSYIFGNSKTLAFRSSDWAPHLQNATFYKFGVPGESVFNIYNKLKLIVDNNDSLDNVLIVVDEAMIRNFKNLSPDLQGPVYKHHPYTQNENWLKFYASFFNYYLTDLFFIKVITENFNDNSRDKNVQADFLQTQKDMDSITNEFYLSGLENEIKTQGFAGYYNNHAKEFGKRADSHKTLVHEDDLIYFSEINNIFLQHRTNFKIIIGPGLNIKKFPEAISYQLKNIFGGKNVYDYSDYRKISQDSSYFYEWQHYRPAAGAHILNEIYKQPLEHHNNPTN